MRAFLICAALFIFLQSSLAPAWGPKVAGWGVVVALLLFIGSAASKVKVPYRRNRYYDNDYYDQQHP